MLYAETTTFIRDDPWKISAVFADYEKWPEIFPLSIRGVKLLGKDRKSLILEIDYKEGQVRDVLRIVSPARIELDEPRKKYDVRFVCHFAPNHGGTMLRLAAEVDLKGRKRYRLLRPVLRRIAVHQMKKFISKPLKRYMEAQSR